MVLSVVKSPKYAMHAVLWRPGVVLRVSVLSDIVCVSRDSFLHEPLAACGWMSTWGTNPDRSLGAQSFLESRRFLRPKSCEIVVAVLSSDGPCWTQTRARGLVDRSGDPCPW